MFNNSNLARRVRLTSALSLATLLSVGVWSPIQAAPDPNPPIRGNADRNRPGQNNRGDVLRGTVDRVFSARSFDLRANDGRIYRVNMRFSVGLEARSDVRVRGDLRGSNFDARTVTVGDFSDNRYDDDYNYNDGYNNGDYNNGGQYQGQNVTLRGRVTRVYSRNDIEVRDDDDGRIYRVRTDRALDNSIREGDRIETMGTLDGTNIRANSAVEIGANDGNFGNNGDNGDASFVSFSGPIERLDLNREEATVRAGNGYVYTIRARRAQLDDFRVGQRVRVQGNWINQRVEVTQITRE